MNHQNIDLCFIMPVYFNQKNTDALTGLLRKYSQYDSGLMQRIEFIIVDDHSPVPVIIPEDIKLNYRLLRITDDIPWNQAGARNLGAALASSPRLVLTDCDHLFPERLLHKIISSSVSDKTFYKFKRIKQTGETASSPCNIFYISKSAFFSVLGYDEEFCGYYGYEDVMFRDFQKSVGRRLRYFTRRDPIVSLDVDRDNSYHSLVRDTTRNEKLLNRKRILLHSKNPFAAHSRLFLNFQYQKIQEQMI